jgi:hypothetical protein
MKKKQTQKKKKKAKRELKKWNVFYTVPATTYETVVEAYSLEDAVDMVKHVLNESVESVYGGWEIFDGVLDE